MGVQNLTNTNLSDTNARSDYAMLAPPLFSVIIVFGSVGNTLLVYTVLRWREMRTPCNYLIVNNAIADLGSVFIAAPLRIIEVYHGWVFGEPACRIVAPIQDVFGVVSIATYSLIAWERYRAVVTPFKAKLTLRRISITVVVVWIVAYLSAGLPIALHLNLIKIGGTFWCTALFASDLSRQIYEVYLVVAFLVIPLTTQTMAYSRLLHRLTQKDDLERSLSNSRSSRKRKVKKRRLVRVTVILIVFFHVCTIPRMVMMLLYEFAPLDFIKSTAFDRASVVVMALFYVRHVINPMILFSISTDYRKRFPCRVRNFTGRLKSRVFSSRRSTQNTRLNMSVQNSDQREIINKESAL